jgi:SAM-dependent methyltransferase
VGRLRHRSEEPEALDLGVEAGEARKSLADLRLVNRFLGNRRALLRMVRLHLGDSGRVLDVGAASADLLAELVPAEGGPVRGYACDWKRLHLLEAPARLHRVVADARALPFSSGACDVVMANLFLHHFTAAELPGLLGSLYAPARRALVVSDLRRAWVPYLFGHLAFPLLFRSRVSVGDGLVSLRRGFHEEELMQAARHAGVPLRLRRSFPYRLLGVAVKR